MIKFWKPASKPWSGRISVDGDEYLVQFNAGYIFGTYAPAPDDSRYIPCSVKELVEHYAASPGCVEAIWNLVEEHDGCRCWVDDDLYYRIYTAETMVCFFSNNHAPRCNHPESFSEKAAKEDGYRRISLDEVLAATKGNTKLTQRMLNFVESSWKHWSGNSGLPGHLCLSYRPR